MAILTWKNCKHFSSLLGQSRFLIMDHLFVCSLCSSVCLCLSLYHWVSIFLPHHTSSLPSPVPSPHPHYPCLCRCLAFSVLQNSIFGQNVFGPELSQKVTHTTGVSRLSLGGERAWLTYGEWNEDFWVPEVALRIQEVARVEGIWLLKVAWVVEGRTQDGIHGNALRGC